MKEVISEDAPISSVSLVGKKLIVKYLQDTITKINFDLEGTYLSDLDFPQNGSINGFYGNLKIELRILNLLITRHQKKYLRLMLKLLLMYLIEI